MTERPYRNDKTVLLGQYWMLICTHIHKTRMLPWTWIYSMIEGKSMFQFKYIYKYLNCPGPISCQNMFTYVSDYHELYTRASHTSKFILPNLNLTMTQRSICYFGAKIRQEISEIIKSSPNLESSMHTPFSILPIHNPCSTFSCTFVENFILGKFHTVFSDII